MSNVIENNPFASPIRILSLTAKDYLSQAEPVGELPDIPLLAPGTNNPNPYCKFLKLEMEESVMSPFPEGKILVYDLADLASLMTVQGYNQVYCEFLNGEKYVWDIKQTSYINNAISEKNKTVFEISFTNKLYYSSQDFDGNDAVAKLLQFPMVGKIVPLVELFLGDVKTQIGQNSPPINTFINSADPENYVLFRPRNMNQSGMELKNDSYINSLHYYFTYATCNNNPYFMFWTDFSNSVNYKYFDLDYDFENFAYSRTAANNNPLFIKSFKIYNNDVPSVVDGDYTYYKISAMTAIPYGRKNRKNPYYERFTPKHLDVQSGDTAGITGVYQGLASLFMQHAEQYNDVHYKSMVSDGNGGLTSATGASFLVADNTPWGYPTQNQIITGRLKNDLNNTEIIARRGYTADETFWDREFVDSIYMYQTQFDITPLHPNLPSNTDFDGDWSTWDDCNLNRVMWCSKSPIVSGTDEQAVVATQQEKLNILKYVLCCIGKQVPEPDWCFALLTGFERIYPNGQYGPWWYYWVKIDPTILPDGYTNFDLEDYRNLYGNIQNQNIAIHLNEMFNDQPDLPAISCYLRGRGLTFHASDETDGNCGHWTFLSGDGNSAETWVPFEGGTGLNTNLYTADYYVGPGYDTRNLSASSGFKYRPIGYIPLTASTTPETSGGVSGYNEIPSKGLCRHIVKMYKYTDAEGNFFWYMQSPTNVVEGQCLS